jgi:hypothetical protein
MTSFTPAGGTAGTIVDIHGWNFSSATLVTFGGSTYANGVPAVFTVDSNSEIHATVPAGANDGLISVTTPGGTARSAAVFWVTPPSITSFTPTHGPVGTTVVILGSGLSHVTAVSFNGSPALYTIVTDSDVRATVPTGSTSGPISVTTPAGTATSASVFTVG